MFFPLQFENFSLETLKSEIWTESADGVEVNIFNETEQPLACYALHDGDWKTHFDDLADSNSPNAIKPE